MDGLNRLVAGSKRKTKTNFRKGLIVGKKNIFRTPTPPNTGKKRCPKGTRRQDGECKPKEEKVSRRKTLKMITLGKVTASQVKKTKLSDEDIESMGDYLSEIGLSESDMDAMAEILDNEKIDKKYKAHKKEANKGVNPERILVTQVLDKIYCRHYSPLKKYTIPAQHRKDWEETDLTEFNTEIE